MTDRRRDPFTEIEQLFDRLSAELGDVGADLGVGGDVRVDVAETADAVVLTADLPGYAAADIEVTVKERSVEIAAERERDEPVAGEDPDGRFHRRERSHDRVSRTVSLPTTVAEDEATAEHENGVLTVTLPKRAVDGEGHSIDIE